ncbi:MAG: hypothetical protein JWM49_1839 [Microbacteriaceae bacterium]|nr:hypothetical protein [Microbacteriaceae bacterium]
MLFVALAILVSGFISLYGGREVLTERDAGPLVAPVMFLVAACTLYIQLVIFGVRRGSLLAGALICAVVTYLFFMLSGAILYTLGRGQLLIGLLFFGSNALGPYAIAVGVIAFVIGFAFLLLISYRDSGGLQRTPRWWWENRDDRDRRNGD